MNEPPRVDGPDADGMASVLPRELLAGMGVLVVVSLVLALIGSTTGLGQGPAVQPGDLSPNQAVALLFREAPGGVLHILDATSGARIAEVRPDEGGFVRGVLRPLARERMLRGHDMTPPMYLGRTSAGDLTLDDPFGGVTLRVAAFGPSSEDAFGRVLAEAHRVAGSPPAGQAVHASAGTPGHP